MTVDQATFRQAMTRFPSGVTIVTTVDDSSQRWGFTASAFASLSLSPPLVLVCLDRSANCYSSFCATDRFAINILSADHEALARRFATKGIDKFAGVDFEPGEFELPLLSDAVATFECQRSALLPGGDHVILIGEALSIRLGSGTPAVLFNRRFWRFLESTAAVHPNGAAASRSTGPATGTTDRGDGMAEGA
jgi:flavin reductase ActVB